MRAVVFAYHDMGITGLESLKRAGFEIDAIFSHVDDPGENCWFGSVSDWAAENDIPLFCPENVNRPDWRDKISIWRPQVIFSFYYRRLLGLEILGIPTEGAFNLHGSLLPFYRGRCPVNWVLVNGEKETGVTLHRMVEEPDAGDIVAQEAVPIAFEDTARSLYKKLCRQAAHLLDGVLPEIKDGEARAVPQDWRAGSYFGGRTPQDGRIDWRWPALRIYNLIRAVTDPYPGAFTLTKSGEIVIIWWGIPEEGNLAGESGKIKIEKDAVFVSTGDGGRMRLLDIEVKGERLKKGAISSLFISKEGEVLP